MEGNLAIKFLLKSGDFLSMVTNSAVGATKNGKSSSTGSTPKEKEKSHSSGSISKNSNPRLNKQASNNGEELATV